MSGPRQIAVLSGKGGTGKTSFTASFAALARDAVLADCDVDAADLALILRPARDLGPPEPFRSGWEPALDGARCTGCEICASMCRFGAIAMEGDGASARPRVDRLACEGCGLCACACPAQAITMRERVAGEMRVSETRFGPLVHARLDPGEGASGKLVTRVRERSREIAAAMGREFVIVDGSPGIGCPVIASLAACDAALIVAEPTIAGFSDLERLADLLARFRIPAAVAVNKHDLSDEITRSIEARCGGRGIALAGRVPMDPVFVRALMAGRAVVEEANGAIGDALASIWERTAALAADR